MVQIATKNEAAPAGDSAVRASEHAKDDERFCTFIRSLVVLVLVCVVVLVHAGVPMYFNTYEVRLRSRASLALAGTTI